MTANDTIVEDLYNKLHSLEQRVRRDNSYPIHKKLKFTDNSIADIYDWISKEVTLTPVSHVLDAGCGVGFGSIRIAEKYNCNVTGISLSQQEIDQARSTASAKEMGSNVEFIKQSYDDDLKKKFDCIIAVESLKHSADLASTCNNISAHLSKGGKLVIVEDFYKPEQLDHTATAFVEDWKLADAYRLADYYKCLSKDNCTWHNLTSLMAVKSKVATKLQIAANSFLHKVKGGKEMDVYKIFRGGYYLDKLYAAGHMSYGVLIYIKP